jgi:hypothetical protein
MPRPVDNDITFWSELVLLEICENVGEPDWREFAIHLDTAWTVE